MKFNLYPLYLLLFISWFPSFGQESSIAISEERLQRLAYTLYELKLNRNEQLAKKNNTSLDSLTIELNKMLYKIDSAGLENNMNGRQKEKTTTNTEKNSRSIQEEKTALTQKEIVSENEYLQEILSKLEAIEKQLNNKEEKGSKTSYTSDSEESSEPKKEVPQKSEKNNQKNKRITSLQDAETSLLLAMQLEQRQARKNTAQQLDSLLTIVNLLTKDSLNKASTSKGASPVIEKDTTTSAALRKLTTQMYLLEAKLDQVLQSRVENTAVEKVTKAMQSTDTVYVENTKVINPGEEAYLLRIKKYEGFFQQVFFANNSIEIEEKYTSMVDQLVNQLNEEPKIDILLEGFASAKGSAAYNQQISMKRAVALKEKLIEKGIPAQRILTDYKGIDSQANNEAAARRLDIKYLIRR